ncbi:alpha-glucuronidase [Algibacter amylolyticus]|uniref:Xylan alpha-1,2-glucuronidase n=1 Tax=Algibacter amylolyticus TaxID=1608400 RepID=A0A5M7BCP6_9FLAO|nr:alpha-glucuronidase family glycosyl hydrolase [Algibacter amylolyticus]KAA5826420.1 alpha-glucuronidase [Algibacter amylolyticus]MBB5268629.1 alpha-glucuronidase [Algibacter amylolyticus]TSJ80458.1 alpha-glucuronidase [Algibacter amylolyticus]
MKHIKLGIFIFLLSVGTISAQVPNGYNLWLNYSQKPNSSIIKEYQKVSTSVYFQNESDVLNVSREELKRGLKGMLGVDVLFSDAISKSNTLIIATKNNLHQDIQNTLETNYKSIGDEGFIIKSIQFKGKQIIVISANQDVGILYGVFRFLRLLQMETDLSTIHIIDSPKLDLRMLNHWDNLDRTVERGYAGFSLWNWQKLPDFIDQRYIDYARANASIGINGTVLNNVNASALILTPMYLEKVAALANVFRPYGIKVYLTARFSAPIEIGGLDTADPLNSEVQNWWNTMASNIYKAIPDFGGFLVKANSEGQPGPQNYNRTHVDGANMLAKALQPHNGVVIWRSFVYSEHDVTDRAKQAYSEFVPFDGKFMDNVLVQSKNGPIDFQPREPFHPMFGAMPNTNLMMEFQITQEYLGFSTHLVFLPKLFEEVLKADTYAQGKGTTVAKVIDGSITKPKLTGIAGVSNIGNDINWTGHPFAQANWYGFGRLAWNPHLSSETIADEWLRATYCNNSKFIEPVKNMMLNSREAVVNYMNPLGLHHLFDTNHHYGPGPWVSNLSRPEWNPTYYHKADENGIGFNRSSTGSNAVEQYANEVAHVFNTVETCPEDYLLWFHHVPWDYKLKNGESLWNGLALKYQEGVNQVSQMIATWNAVKPYVSEAEYKEVDMLLNIQLKEAKWWKDASLLYFQTFSKQPFPKDIVKPEKSLEYYKSLKFPFAPGIRPHWD